LIDDFSACSSTAYALNCKVYKLNVAVEDCTECKDNYTLIGVTCIEKTITNCQTYKTTSTSPPQPECDVCEVGYYLSSDNTYCGTGNVKDCELFE
jgi:hypothetical protein